MQRNAKKLLAKLGLTISLLLLPAVGVSAADYVIYYNGSYVYANATGNPATTNVFDPNTCLWTSCNSSGQEITTIGTDYNSRCALKNKSNGRYLSVKTSGTRYLQASTSNNLYWYLNGSYLCYRIGSGTYYYRYWINSSGGIARNTSDTPPTNATFGMEVVTTTFNSEVNNASVTINTNSTELTSEGSSTSIWSSFSGSYTPSYYTYTFNYNNHNYWSGTDYGWNTPTLWSGNDCVYEWSIDPSCSGYQYVSLSGISGTNCTLNYLSFAETDAVAKVMLNVTHPNYPDLLLTSNVNISLLQNRIDPVSINANDIALEYGNTSTISYTISPSNAFKYVTFESANPSIVSVNSSGVVTGISIGTTTITLSALKSDGVTVAATKTITVTVKAPEPTSIIANNIELYNGSTSTISYTLSPPDAFEHVTFESANSSIASVDGNGLVTGNSVGSTTITLRAYKSDMSTVGAYTTINVTVKMVPVEPTSISSNNIELEAGSNSTISYTLSPSNAFNSVTFESANPLIASVNSSGVVTGMSIGTTNITLIAYKSDGVTIAAYTTISATVLNNSGSTPDKPYYISSQSGLDYIRTHLANHFVVSADIDLSGFSSISGQFTGSINGDYHVIRGLTSSLFTSTNGATIKNVVLDDVNITSGTNVGPLVNEAAGATRIYNCGVRATNSSSVTGTGYVGGLIGRINNNTRVINCYSFANVSGGSWAAGIVGYNPTATTTSNITTAGLIMNCMYYGRIISGTNRAPVYGGSIISNAGSTGINNYNYYSLSSNINPTTYNCALAAEERYLTRFEFYRGILNSNRKLCAFYVKGSVGSTDEIGKWVLDPSIAEYPIIKAWGKYPSIINRSTVDAVSKNAYEGKGLGTLSVTINRGSYGSGSSSEIISLPITDMDTLSYDYNYYKVQLPYYNDYFSGNYSGNKVVTGWRVTAISGGTAGTFSTSGDDAYNFANRYCTAKDLYSTSGAVFAQGGFFNVPEGVTAITIQANWASAVYLSDPNYDKVYTTAYSGSNYTVAGSVPTSYNSQTVYTTLANAISNVPTGTTVYDAAIVLVGNYHTLSESWDNGTKPFTVMSVDDNGDNEPDYCMIHGHSSDRVVVNPIRFDFLWHPGLGMTSKVTGTTQMPNQSIFKPKGHFEITETALGRYTEFEYDYSGKANGSPLILMGGIFEQFVSIFNDGTLASHTSYIKIGGNVFFNSFSPGCHPEQTTGTNHQPISVLGGEYPEFYLSGLRPNATTTATNANCFVNGGRFHMFAGACQEKINGNVTIKVDHALVDEFYGGGINSASPITGNINVTIDNSRVGFYCGGPKFGDMGTGKTVTTNATGSTFSEYYGAGFGGTSISSVVTDNTSSAATYPTNYFTSFSNNRGSYDATNGIMTGYKMEYFDWAGATTTSHVARFYVNRASLSLAMVRNVTSTLNNCTILNNFYGGGCLGTVNGTITSTLNNCTVLGNVFGGGYSVEIPVCDVYPTVAPTFPAYDGNTGTFSSAILPTPTKHTWSNLGSTSNPFTTNENGNWIFTNVDFSNLGKVSGNTIVTVTGASRIDGALFGGGDESMVTGNTSVTVSTAQTYKISTVYGGGNIANVGGSTVVNVNNGLIDNVFGGGNNADIGGNTSVRVLDGEILGNVYGGGNQGDVIGSPSVQIGTTPAP